VTRERDEARWRLSRLQAKRDQLQAELDAEHSELEQLAEQVTRALGRRGGH
jgi:uncharacterized protein YPO0396